MNEKDDEQALRIARETNDWFSMRGCTPDPSTQTWKITYARRLRAESAQEPVAAREAILTALRKRHAVYQEHWSESDANRSGAYGIREAIEIILALDIYAAPVAKPAAQDCVSVPKALLSDILSNAAEGSPDWTDIEGRIYSALAAAPNAADQGAVPTAPRNLPEPSDDDSVSAAPADEVMHKTRELAESQLDNYTAIEKEGKK